MKRSVLRRAVLLAVFGLIAMFVLSGCASAPTLALLRVPDRTEYAFGEALALEGGKLRLTLPDGAVDIAMTDEAVTFTGYDPFVLGNQEIKVFYTYGETVLSAVFSVTVAERVVKETGIRIAEPPNRTSYVEGQKFDPEGIRVFVGFEDGTERLLSDGYAFSIGENVTFADNGAGEVRYHGFSATFYLSVIRREKLGLKVSSPPETTVYAAGEAPSLAGARFSYSFNDGSEEPVSDETVLTVSPERLFFGEEKFSVSDGTDSVDVPVTVEKREGARNLAAETEAMIAKLRTGAEVACREALFTFEILKTESVSIGGESFRLDVPHPKLVVSKSDSGTPALNDLAFWVEPVSETGEWKLRVYLLCLLSYGKREVVVETDNDRFLLTLSADAEMRYSKREASKEFGSGTELRFYFDAPNNENAVVIAAKRDGIDFGIKLFSPSRSEAEIFIAPGDFKDAVFWWNSALCRETNSAPAEARRSSGLIVSSEAEIKRKPHTWERERGSDAIVRSKLFRN